MNRWMLFRQLLPGLAPLLVFIVADEVWGTKVGLLVAVGFGVVQLFYNLVKGQKPDRFVIIDLGLIIAMGGVSLWLENDFFFKLKPVIIGLMLGAMMGVAAFMPGNFMLDMSKRYFPGLEINPWQQYEFKQSLKQLFFVIVIHTILTVATVFWGTTQQWGWVSGPGFFVLFGGYFGWEFWRKRRQMKVYASEEWVPLVDEQGNITGKAPRSVVHKGTRLLHPVVHLHVIKNRCIYLQKRPQHKLIQPGKWDTAVGGHIAAGESIELSLQREAVEEIGLHGFEASLLTRYVWESEVERELVFAFVTQTNKPLVPNAEEVDEGRFWTLSEIDDAMGKGMLTPNFESEYSLLKQYVLNPG
jgi:isopentenyldiphosphate isomerase/intracellular septation protein A